MKLTKAQEKVLVAAYQLDKIHEEASQQRSAGSGTAQALVRLGLLVHKSSEFVRVDGGMRRAHDLDHWVRRYDLTPEGEAAAYGLIHEMAEAEENRIAAERVDAEYFLSKLDWGSMSHAALVDIRALVEKWIKFQEKHQ